MKDDKTPLRILVIRFSSLGDVILSTAILPNLKAKWPTAEITFLTKDTYTPLFERNPYVDRVIGFNSSTDLFSTLIQDVRHHHFDIIIDLHRSARSWLLRFFAGPPMAVVVEKCTIGRRALVFLKTGLNSCLKNSFRERVLDCAQAVDVPIVSTSTQLFPADEAEKILGRHGIDSKTTLIGIAPGAQHKTKRWMPERFAEAANRLGALPDSMVVLLGDKNDADLSPTLNSLIKVPCKNLIGQTSMTEAVAIVSKLSFLLTNDSGLLHMAEALNIPLVALFGPTVKAFGFAPYRATSGLVEVSNLECRPCSLHGLSSCPLKHHKCMDDIDLTRVLFAIKSVFKKSEDLSL